MSVTHDFDDIARAWLDLMPDEAPDHAIDSVLQAIDATPQVRRTWRWPTWRSILMSKSVAALGAAAIVIVVGGTLLLRGTPGPGVGSSPSPSARATPSATPTPSASVSPSLVAAGPIPTELLGRWMGGHRHFADGGAGTSIVFTSTGYEMDQSNDNGHPRVAGDAASLGDGRLRLAKAIGYDCDQQAVGDYSWILSPSGRVLTISLEQDACGARAGDMPGTYWLMACRISATNCLGDLDAGTYSSQYIRPLLAEGAEWSPLFGGVAYSVPEGWANYSEWPGVLGLTTSTDFAKTSGDKQPVTRLIVSTHAQPGCGSGPVASPPSTVAAAFADLRKVNGLNVGTIRALTISGYPAAYADVSFDGNARACAGYLTGGGDTFSIQPGERQRLYLVDVGSPGFVAIWLSAPDAPSFAAVVTPAAAIAESMQFK